MGNTPSIQHRTGRKDSDNFQEPNNVNYRPTQSKYLLEVDKGRQSSITSQLFPSRKTRHTPSGLDNLRRKTYNVVPHTPLFKKNYSLELTGAGAQGPNNDNDNSKTANDDPRAPNEANFSTENVRENIAGLSIKYPNETGPMFFSPGPATPTVQPTKEEAIPPMDDSMIFRNKQSVVALKKNLEGSEQCSPGLVFPTNTEARTDPKGTKKTKQQPEQNASAVTTTTTATSSATNDRPSIDTDPESSDIDNINDDGCLQSKDIVLNQSLLHNVIKRDMKRRRDKEASDNTNVHIPTVSAVKLDSNDNDASVNKFAFNNETLRPMNNYSTSNGHNVEVKLESESPHRQNDFPCDRLESNHPQDAKKLKPIHHGILLPHSCVTEKVFPDGLQHHGKFYSMESFEKGSVEHREVEDQNRNSSLSSFSSSAVSRSSQDVRVAIKWRDQLPSDSPNKICMVSEDIASTLCFEKGKYDAHNSFPMKYEDKTNEWVVPDLVLPVGVYRLQFLINGELRHSNYLPTATDSVGNFVNWFEVVAGYDEVEPYRDEVELDSRQPPHAEGNELPTSALSLENEGSEGTVLMEPVPGKMAGRPQLTSMNHSSNRVLRSTTPYSDYTGISGSSSALRKSPTNYTTSSLDLTTALQPKQYKYSSEIPELFKTTPSDPTNNDNGQFTFGYMEPPIYGWNHQHSSNNTSFSGQVVDCNQDELFNELQQGGILDAETAEQLFLEKYPVPDLPIYLNSYYLNKIISEFQKNNHPSGGSGGINHIIPHVNLNHLLTSSIRDEMISVGCTTRYEGKFITQVIYAPCYYENGRTVH